jgi:hypothetical protein
VVDGVAQRTLRPSPRRLIADIDLDDFRQSREEHPTELGIAGHVAADDFVTSPPRPNR